MNPLFVCMITEEQERHDMRAAQLGRNIVKREKFRDSLALDLKNCKRHRRNMCQLGLSTKYVDLAMVVLKNNYNKNQEMLKEMKGLYKNECKQRDCFDYILDMMEEGE